VRLVELLQAEKAELQDKYLRAEAETQNVRRRGQQEVERERKYASSALPATSCRRRQSRPSAVGVAGDLESTDPALRNVITGVQATERELKSVLERHGVTRIESVGKPFNADFHQAMMEIEDPSVPAGTVVQELIPGYLLAGRLLRAAMVAVSKGGPQRPIEASNETPARELGRRRATVQAWIASCRAPAGSCRGGRINLTLRRVTPP